MENIPLGNIRNLRSLCLTHWLPMTSLLGIKREMFTQAIQMQLFEKPKVFHQFFIAFLESTWNFQRFEKTIKHSSTLSAILDSERSCYLNVLNAMFWTPLGVYNFLLYFCNLHQILNILKRSIRLIPQLYRILFTPKDLVT